MADDYSAQDALDDGAEGVDENGVGGYAQRSVIGGTLASLAIAISGLILSFGETLLAPVRAFTSGIATFISGTLGAPVIITDAGAQASAASFTTGAAAALGPAAFPVAVAVSVAGMFVFLWFIENTSFSPLALFRRED